MSSENHQPTNSNPCNTILYKIEGNPDCFNDVIIFKCSKDQPKYNLIYFGGDIQNYEDEMKKNSTCRLYSEWDLIKTGNLIYKKFSFNPKTCANVFIFRADYFHLKCFANYSNFVPSTDFGIPLDDSKDCLSVLDQKEENSQSSIPEYNFSNKLQCYEHIKALYVNSIKDFNSKEESKIDETLPIIICGFSKGCVVLNQLFTELASIDSNLDQNEQNIDFLKSIKHIFWLDGGHSGSSNSWLTSEEAIKCIKNSNLSCYVYVTPYQMKSLKFWAIQEYETFMELLKKFDVTFKSIYYFKDQESEDYDVNLHFELLKYFDTNLI
ncbi:unnamed protein product [Brachionus calyciflorus]|uniref:Uncharacterized protein n=1 Tax=Brachionus calyciflorus TaxID=104777 RepID=A0A813M8F7_9BILA|nr:unnamed protein product [Brachionus calyciflorus]